MRYAYATGSYVYKLKGYSKKITQLVENGNFESTSGWSTIRSSISTSNNTLSFQPTAQSTTAFVYRIMPTRWVVGHKYYYEALVKSNIVGKRIGFTYYYGSGYGYDFTSTNYEKFATIINYTRQTVDADSRIGFILENTDTENIINIKNVMLHDLTADFGVGNEPTTVAQCEAYYGNKYIPYGEQILNCKMPIKAYKDGVEVAQIDCGRDLLFNDTLTTDGKVDIGTVKYDLGTLIYDWTIRQTANGKYFRGISNALSIQHMPNFVCQKYNNINIYSAITGTYDNTVGIGFSNNYNTWLVITDTSYDNATTFKTAMNGVMLDYELATHTTSTFNHISLKDNLTFVDDNGYEVEVLESKFEVKKWKAVRKGKNLFDKNIPIRFIDVNGLGAYRYGWKIFVPKGTYTISYASVEPYGDSFCKTLINNVYGEYKQFFGTTQLTLSENGYILLYSLNATVKFYNLQIEEGSTATSYEQYGLKSYLPTTRLPLEYQEVKYLESTGIQWIDTGLSITDTTSITADVQFTRTNIEQLSGYHWANNYGFAFGVVPNLITTKFVALCGNSGSWVGVGTLDTNRHIFKLERNNGKTIFSVDNETAQANWGTLSPMTIIIGARRNLDNKDDYCYAKWRKVEIDTRGEFIPCYRRSDHKAGMYDTVNNVFHTNQGQGEFILGEEI